MLFRSTPKSPFVRRQLFMLIHRCFIQVGCGFLFSEWCMRILLFLKLFFSHQKFWINLENKSPLDLEKDESLSEWVLGMRILLRGVRRLGGCENFQERREMVWISIRMPTINSWCARGSHSFQFIQSLLSYKSVSKVF